MKTFKLISICLFERKLEKVEKVPIEIKDGLIINMEDQEQTWYIDAVISNDHLTYFQHLKEEGKNVLVEVIITSKDNHPAAMITCIDTITELSEHISVLFEAKLAVKKDDVIENILTHLVNNGHLNKNVLPDVTDEFKNQTNHSKHRLESLFHELEERGQYNL
ncbi:hypothetical protein GN156_04415 [bacterium LRH843]|nr:hypothetical protein [bacterium LRH843]